MPKLGDVVGELGGDSGLLMVGVASHELLKSNLDAAGFSSLKSTDERRFHSSCS